MEGNNVVTMMKKDAEPDERITGIRLVDDTRKTLAGIIAEHVCMCGAPAKELTASITPNGIAYETSCGSCRV
jgi:hypothetical protein